MYAVQSRYLRARMTLTNDNVIIVNVPSGTHVFSSSPPPFAMRFWRWYCRGATESVSTQMPGSCSKGHGSRHLELDASSNVWTGSRTCVAVSAANHPEARNTNWNIQRNGTHTNALFYPYCYATTRAGCTQSLPQLSISLVQILAYFYCAVYPWTSPGTKPFSRAPPSRDVAPGDSSGISFSTRFAPQCPKYVSRLMSNP